MRAKARVERFRAIKVGGYLNTRTRARLPCGCCIYVGISSETLKPATASQACSADHQIIIELADAMLTESTGTVRRNELLVNACARYLTEAASQA